MGNPCGKVERLPLLRLNDFAQPFRREFAQLGKGIDAGIVEPFGIDLTNTMNVRQGVWARRNGRRNRGNGYLALQVTNFEASCFQFPSQPALFIDTDILFLTPEAPVDNPFNQPTNNQARKETKPKDHVDPQIFRAIVQCDVLEELTFVDSFLLSSRQRFGIGHSLGSKRSIHKKRAPYT